MKPQHGKPFLLRGMLRVWAGVDEGWDVPMTWQDAGWDLGSRALSCCAPSALWGGASGFGFDRGVF